MPAFAIATSPAGLHSQDNLPTDPIVTANTTHTAPENRVFFPALDGMRAIAFLLVFAHHYAHLEIGWIGVDMFFVLSGFLITGILYDTRDDPHRIRNFYVRRSLRIFPLYYAALLVLLFVAPFAHWLWDWRWLVWPLYAGNLVLFFHHGPIDAATVRLYNGWLIGSPRGVVFIGHFWSLCVEEQFYLIWPWVVFKIRSRRTLLAISAGIVILWPLFRLLGLHYLPADRVAADIIAHGTLFRLDSLMMGALVALLFRGPARAALFKASSMAVWAAGTITGAALIAFVLHPALLHNRGFKPLLFTLGFTVIAFFAAVLMVRCLGAGSFLTRVFSNPFLRWMGRISYGAYVFHDLPHFFYDHLAHRLHLYVSVVAIFPTFALAWLSFRYFESPFLELKKHFTASNRQPVAEQSTRIEASGTS